MGYSLGGGVALRTAIYLPGKVGRLVAASAHIRSDAIYAEMLAQQGQVNAAAAEFMKDTRGTTSTSESRRDRRTSLDYSTSSVS